MSLRQDNLNERRRELAAQIARQRGEFTEAYRNLAKPIQYAEYGLRGFGFIRQNPWVFSVLPAFITVTTSLIGIIRNKPAKRSRAPKWGEDERRAEKASKSIGGHIVKWGGRGWKLFRLYGRLRKYFL
jgi:hypothetical protein